MSHIHEKLDFSVCVYIVHDAKVLLHMHKKLRTWYAPGGHVELDEDPNETAIREVKEEAGIDVALVGKTVVYDSPFAARELIPPRFLTRAYYDETHTHEHINLAFFARPITFDVRPEGDDGEVRWFTAEDLEDPRFGVLADVQAEAKVALEELAM